MNAALVEVRRPARGGEVLVVVEHDEAVVSRGGADGPSTVDRSWWRPRRAGRSFAVSIHGQAFSRSTLGVPGRPRP
ncbi:hypothetical protein ACWCOW_26210 [Streptomyces sp. NPDC001939]